MNSSLLTDYFERILQDTELQRRLRQDGSDIGALVTLLRELQLESTPQAFRQAAYAFTLSHRLEKLEVNDLNLLQVITRTGEPPNHDA
jgi:hypothetical protein